MRVNSWSLPGRRLRQDGTTLRDVCVSPYSHCECFLMRIIVALLIGPRCPARRRSGYSAANCRRCRRLHCRRDFLYRDRLWPALDSLSSRCKKRPNRRNAGSIVNYFILFSELLLRGPSPVIRTDGTTDRTIVVHISSATLNRDCNVYLSFTSSSLSTS